MIRRTGPTAWGLAAAIAIAVLGGIASCSPAGPPPGAQQPGAPAPPVVRPDPGADVPPPAMPAESGVLVRVGLAVDADTVIVSGTGPFEVVAPDRRVVHRAAADDRLLVVYDRGLHAIAANGQRIALPELASVRPTDAAESIVMIDHAAYRGAVFFRGSGDGVTAVNALDLETYLLGVVPREIPATQFEAVKAQAVAARTYAIGHMGRRGALGFDFYATVADQVYGGAGAENEVATRAVRETAGEILTYGGEPIDAYYHSTCGGRTAAIEEVWNQRAVPYLRSVSDAKPGGGHYCERSSRFRWTEEWSGETLREVLGRTLAPRGAGTVRAVRDIEVVEETRSGRAGRTRIRLADSDYLVRGDSIRWILRTADGRLMNSSLLLDIREDRRDGALRHLAIDGGGWGHGIGMCQVGAMGRAAEGQNYAEILAAYYPGTDLARIF